MKDAALDSGASAPRLSPHPDVLTADELRQRVFVLYVLERLSGPKTAAAVGIGSTTVYEVLKQLGLQRRSQRAAQAPVPIEVDDNAALVLDDGTPNWVVIGRALRSARTTRRLSQRQLAPFVGADRTSIQKIENGRQVPSLDLARRIANALEVEFADLFPDPPACGRCGERASFEPYCQGHGPKYDGPVLTRRDRAEGDGTGATVRAARIGLGLTQAELAERCHSTLQRISNIESGSDVPSARLAVALADALDLPQPFDVRPCRCGECGRLVIGDRYAHGCAPLSAETKRALSEQREEWWASDASAPHRAAFARRLRKEWKTGGPMIVALFDLARRGTIPVPIWGATREVWGGRWGGNRGPAEGKKRGRRAARHSDEVVAAVAQMVARGWGRPQIQREMRKRGVELSDRQAKKLMAEAAASDSAPR